MGRHPFRSLRGRRVDNHILSHPASAGGSITTQWPNNPPAPREGLGFTGRIHRALHDTPPLPEGIPSERFRVGDGDFRLEEIVGMSPALRNVFSQIDQVAP